MRPTRDVMALRHASMASGVASARGWRRRTCLIMEAKVDDWRAALSAPSSGGLPKHAFEGHRKVVTTRDRSVIPADPEHQFLIIRGHRAFCRGPSRSRLP